MSWKIIKATDKDDIAAGNLILNTYLSVYSQKIPQLVFDEAARKQFRDTKSKREQGTVFVAVTPDGQIIGSITALRSGSPLSEAWLPKAGDLRHLAIVENYRKSGLFEELMTIGEKEAFNHGSDIICGHIIRGADKLAEIYRMRGWEKASDGDQFSPHTPLVYLEGIVLRKENACWK